MHIYTRWSDGTAYTLLQVNGLREPWCDFTGCIVEHNTTIDKAKVRGGVADDKHRRSCVWTVYGLHVTGCQLLYIARTLLVMWVVWCTRAYSVVEDVWSWTSWVGIGALVRALAPIAHSLRHLFVHLLPGPCGHVALHIAVHCPSFLSLLPLGALPGWCGIRARMELELIDRAVGATGACGCPPPLRRPCGAGPGGASWDRHLPDASRRWRTKRCEASTVYWDQDWQELTKAWEPGAANVRAPVNVRRRVRVRAARRG